MNGQDWIKAPHCSVIKVTARIFRKQREDRWSGNKCDFRLNMASRKSEVDDLITVVHHRNEARLPTLHCNGAQASWAQGGLFRRSPDGPTDAEESTERATFHRLSGCVCVISCCRFAYAVVCLTSLCRNSFQERTKSNYKMVNIATRLAGRSA